MDDGRPILLIEDDPTSVELFQRAFGKVGLKRPLRALPHGEAAVAYLSGSDPYQDGRENPPPCLIVLDVKLPGRSGIDVLSWLKSQLKFRSIPVLMLTGSAASADIDEALRLGAKSYCVKPQSFDDLIKLARAIRRRVDGAAVEEDTLPQAG